MFVKPLDVGVEGDAHFSLFLPLLARRQGRCHLVYSGSLVLGKVKGQDESSSGAVIKGTYAGDHGTRVRGRREIP